MSPKPQNENRNNLGGWGKKHDGQVSLHGNEVSKTGRKQSNVNEYYLR